MPARRKGRSGTKIRPSHHIHQSYDDLYFIIHNHKKGYTSPSPHWAPPQPLHSSNRLSNPKPHPLHTSISLKPILKPTPNHPRHPNTLLPHPRHLLPPRQPNRRTYTARTPTPRMRRRPRSLILGILSREAEFAGLHEGNGFGGRYGCG
jgi:hypothetical protein